MSDEFVVSVKPVGDISSDIGNGYRGPLAVEVVARLPEHNGLEVQARIALIDGIYEVTEVTLRSGADDQPMPSEALRQLPLRTLVREALAPTIRSLNIGKVIAPEHGDRGDDEAGELRNVAQVYRIARLVGEPPTRAVQDHLKVSRATATRRVAEARKAGELGEDEVGQAGGAQSRLGS